MRITGSTTAPIAPRLSFFFPGHTYAFLGDDLDDSSDPAGEGAIADEDEAADLDGSPRRGLDSRGHYDRFLCGQLLERRNSCDGELLSLNRVGNAWWNRASGCGM